MALKQLRKQVRFYEVVATNRDGGIVDVDPTFWPDLHNHLQKLEPADRRMTFHGARYAGFPRVGMSPALDYLLFGHVRDKADWPYAFDELTGDFGQLQQANGLAEATYLLDVPGTNVVAVLGTSRAANISAIEAWLAHVTNNIRSDNALQLLPVLDRRTNEKLQRASGVTVVTVRMPKGVNEAELREEGEVGAALADATALTLGQMEVEVTWSKGRSRDTSEAVYQQMLRGLRSVVGGKVPVTKVRASLTLDNDEGQEYTEKVDFIRQKVAYPIRFEVNADDNFSEESALRGMLRAVNQYGEAMM